MEHRLVVAACLLTVFMSGGCGSSSSVAAPGMGGAGVGGGATGGGGGTPATCNVLIDDGPVVTPTAVAATAPTPAGGTLVDGTYDLTALTLYTGPGVSASPPSGTFSAVYQITGNIAQQVGRLNGSEARYTSTFTISGTTFLSADTCPMPKQNSDSVSITATPTGFRVYDSVTGGILEQSYTKR
jgi:hypothetical protein